MLHETVPNARSAEPWLARLLPNRASEREEWQLRLLPHFLVLVFEGLGTCRQWPNGTRLPSMALKPKSILLP